MLAHVLAVAVLAAGADDDEDWKFGFTPWFAVGHSWSAWPTDGAMPARRGMGLELNVNALAVTPAERFAVGLTSGFVVFGTLPVMGDSTGPTDGLSVYGLQVLPTVMVQLIDSLSLHARGGYVFSALTPPGSIEEFGAGLVRFGGGFTIIPIQTHAANIGFQLEVMRTQQVAVAAGGPPGTFTATTITLGAGISFNPEL
ncbi:MAG: hypothetical protein Q8S33_25790 [Myxococcales bacterium]|nr:hypothetical protein [Myxococcales bacterium]